jgi:isopenicillin-N epimerase
MRALKCSTCSSLWSFHGDMNPKRQAAPLLLTILNGGERGIFQHFYPPPAAIKFQAKHKWDDVRAACHEMAKDAQTRICNLTGLAPLHSPTDDWFAQMTAVPLPADTDLTTLKSRLYDEYRVEVPVLAWKDRKLIRISIQGYNTKKDVDRLLFALSELL